MITTVPGTGTSRSSMPLRRSSSATTGWRRQRPFGSLIDRGKRLAVCTVASAGAIALDADRRSYTVPALPDDEIVDANGAGDAFFAGVLFGLLSGVALERALRFGSVAGGLAVTSPDLASAELTPERLRAEPI